MNDFAYDPSKLVGLNDTEFRAPDMVGCVEGWRAWNVELEPPPFGTAPKLWSVTFGYYWAPRMKARAECTRSASSGCDGTPGEHCSCGFYSAKSLEHLRSMGYHGYHGGDTISVVGKLACWGKVIEGSQGWRSEFAYPVELYLPFEANRLAKPLADAYGFELGKTLKLLNLLDPTKFPDGYVDPTKTTTKTDDRGDE